VKRDRELIDHLKAIPLFMACSNDELARIASASSVLSYPAGTVLAKEGDLGCEFMVIADGTAEVSVRGKVRTELGPDDYFGEVALIDGGTRTATVTAKTALVAHVLEARDFGVFVQDSPSLARKLLVGVAKRLRDAELSLEDSGS
jgi:CRP-like cAMP-binding protein